MINKLFMKPRIRQNNFGTCLKNSSSVYFDVILIQCKRVVVINYNTFKGTGNRGCCIHDTVEVSNGIKRHSNRSSR